MEAILWDRLLVDIIGLCKIRREGRDIKSLTIIELAASWFEILWYNNQQSDIIANLIDQTWLYRYIRHIITTHDCRNELLGRAFKIT